MTFFDVFDILRIGIVLIYSRCVGRCSGVSSGPSSTSRRCYSINHRHGWCFNLLHSAGVQTSSTRRSSGS